MTALLMIMHPRMILECVYSLEQLDIDKVWLTGYTERQLEPVIAEVVETTDYDVYILVGDDVVVSQPALGAVLEAMQDIPAIPRVVTGYANLDLGPNADHVNIAPPHRDYWQPSFYPLTEARGWKSPLIPTCFVGFALTAMTREMWQAYPFRVAAGTSTQGASSDRELSRRLLDDGVPMFAARDGFVVHVKSELNVAETGRKRVLVGEIEPRVRWQAEGRHDP